MELNKEITLSKCIEGYQNASTNISGKLYGVLLDVQDFYYSDFWESRFKRRLQEEGIKYNPIQLDIIQGMTTELIDKIVFKLFDKDPLYNGVSNPSNMIALNINLDEWEKNDSHIENVVMHEFGHIQYLQKEFRIVTWLNGRVLKSPSPSGLENELDQKYFSDQNEIRQRIIPVIKEMVDNNWSPEQAYYLSENLRNDDLYAIYDKQTLIYWLNNLI